jgi:hypothetical protein
VFKGEAKSSLNGIESQAQDTESLKPRRSASACVKLNGWFKVFTALISKLRRAFLRNMYSASRQHTGKFELGRTVEQ